MIIPALLTTNERIAAERVDLAKRMSGWLHIDVLDNSLYKYQSLAVEDLKKLDFGNLSLEYHCMTNSPQVVVESGVPYQRIIVHVETPDWEKWYADLSNQGIDTWLAISPETALDSVALPNDLAGVVVMGVTPGQSGQALDSNVYNRIEHIKDLHPDLPITIDGGVKEDNLRDFIALGVDNLVMGSALFETKDPLAVYERLNHISDPIYGTTMQNSNIKNQN